MLRQYGRFEGDIQEFSLYNPQGEGRRFMSIAEWINSKWVAYCPFCRKLRALIINADKSWNCKLCGREGKEKRERMKKKELQI